MNAQTLRASAIRPGPNDRETFDPDGLEELASSIREHGLAQPPTVRPVDGGYEIVCGERRFRAMTEILGWSEVPVIVRDMTDAEASAVMLAENVARRDIDAIEEANAYRTRIERFGMTPETIARQAGVSEQRVTDRLALLSLAPELQHLVRRKQVGLKVAVLLSPLDNDRQRSAVDAYHRERLDYAGMAVLCERLHLAQQSESMFDPDSFLQSEVVSEARAAKRATRTDLGTAVLNALEALELAGLSAKARALRETLGMPTDEQPTGAVADYLRERLGAGPVRAEQILTEARKLGWSERTLRRVKSQLGIRSTRLASGWAWAA